MIAIFYKKIEKFENLKINIFPGNKVKKNFARNYFLNKVDSLFILFYFLFEWICRNRQNRFSFQERIRFVWNFSSEDFSKKTTTKRQKRTLFILSSFGLFCLLKLHHNVPKRSVKGFFEKLQLSVLGIFQTFSTKSRNGTPLKRKGRKKF